ncbi:MAG: hypothetical protein HXX80_02690 [Nitrososphaerales archaeon]|nr:hypothetical protein [Nitrososphaerales archaeon]
MNESNLLLVTVNNTGSIPITIIRIFLIDPATEDIITSPLEVSTTLNPGAWDEVNTNYEFAIESVLIKVLTQRGNVKSNIYPTAVSSTGLIGVGPFLLTLCQGFNYTSQQGSIDQYQVKRDNTSTYYEIYGKSWAAQSFVPDQSRVLDYVDLRISVTSTSAASLVVEIRNHDAINNCPGSLIAGASYTVSASSVYAIDNDGNDRDYGDNWVSVNTNPTLTGGTKYWIVLYQQNNATTYRYRWYYSTDYNSYTNGERMIIPAGGGAWTNQSGDFMFKSYRSGKGPAFAIPSTADNIVFYVNLTNLSDKDIAFSRLSFLVVQVIELNPPHSTMINEDEVYFYIVKDTGNPLNPDPYYPDYSQIVQGNGGDTILLFGARSIGSEDLNLNNCLTGLDLSPDNYFWTENLVWCFFVLSWRYVDSNEPYTQTIAYSAIRILPS